MFCVLKKKDYFVRKINIKAHFINKLDCRTSSYVTFPILLQYFLEFCVRHNRECDSKSLLIVSFFLLSQKRVWAHNRMGKTWETRRVKTDKDRENHTERKSRRKPYRQDKSTDGLQGGSIWETKETELDLGLPFPPAFTG